MKNKKYIVIIIAIIIVILIAFFAVRDKELDIESDEITKLYSYLGEVDIHHCGGLNVYNNTATTKNEISDDIKLCMAYYNISTKEEGSLEVTGSNKSNSKICKKGDITLITEESKCSYTKVSKNDINEEYKKIYGEDIEEYQTFYINSYDACYEEGEDYICGEAETFTYSLSSPSKVYRLLYKAIEKKDSIILTDYFLKVTDGKCYTENNNTTENTECTKALEENQEIDEAFIKEYGVEYEHKYSLNTDNNSYYWKESAKKKK